MIKTYPILEAKRQKENITLAYKLPKNTHKPLTYLAWHYGWKVLLLIHKHQVLKRSWLEEKSVSFLQRHGRRELWLIVVITQVGDLIQITNRNRVQILRDRRHDVYKTHVCLRFIRTNMDSLTAVENDARSPNTKYALSLFCVVNQISVH